jgi:sulfonate transport system ATP-binding protein
VIEVRDVFKIHNTPEGDAAALQGLTLNVRDGEMLVVLGPSGSGKSTLLRLLAGLERPSAGTVRIDGEDVGKLAGRALGAWRARTLGYADQHYARALVPELTARDLVGLELALRGAPKRERDARADELLERVGLTEKRNAYPHELSGGEQQRVALARSLVRDPQLLLADEPFGALDALTRLRMHGLLRDLWVTHHPAVLLVTHDVDEAIALADRVIVLEQGRIALERDIDLESGVGGGRFPSDPRFAAIRTELLAALGVTSHITDQTDLERARA